MYLFFVDRNYVDTNYCWQYSTYDLAAYFASVIKIATELQLRNFPLLLSGPSSLLLSNKKGKKSHLKTMQEVLI